MLSGKTYQSSFSYNNNTITLHPKSFATNTSKLTMILKNKRNTSQLRMAHKDVCMTIENRSNSSM